MKQMTETHNLTLNNSTKLNMLLNSRLFSPMMINFLHHFLQPSVILSCDKAQLVALLDRINSPFVRSHASVLQGLMRIIPFLSFGEGDKMRTLIHHFKPYLDLDK